MAVRRFTDKTNTLTEKKINHGIDTPGNIVLNYNFLAPNITVGTTAGSEYPVVRNRARVAEGESYIESNPKDFDKARAVFEEIADDPTADDATLAGAYTGLGDCLFQQAAKKVNAEEDAGDELRGALLNYLRVVVVYENQTRYVSKAMFFAGTVFKLMDDEASRAAAYKMYQALKTRYPASEWAQKAGR